MNSSWKARLIMAIGVAVIIFGDFLGYGNSGNNAPGNSNTSNRHAEQTMDTAVIKEGSTNGLYDTLDSTPKYRMGERLREACLPKLLCEMAAKPWMSLTDKERDLLNLIKSTTMSLSVALSPTRWHFAAHMGQLLRTTDDIAPIGCSQLWPTCPFSSKKLLSISSKFSFR
ncbi:uncharacterized protein LOC134837524 [Culicoides brevitarsis]|uniref:uncharacterized protein LOC134837524 n=1 Tax=Culicoides brevitarsis TaxID=469753 RepID=UPI00307CA735